MVLKLYYAYTQFLHNVRLSHRRIATFSAHRDFLDYCAFLLLLNEFLVDKINYTVSGKRDRQYFGPWL